MSRSGISWDKSIVIALIALFVTALTLVATFTVPEIRALLGLDAPPDVKQPPKVTRPIIQIPEPEPKNKQKSPGLPEPQEQPSGPINYTIHEKQPQFVKKAQTNLSVIFHDVLGEKVASLTIAPAGKASSTHAVLNGYTQKFTSSIGTFLVQILYVDYEARNIKIQVSRTELENRE